MDSFYNSTKYYREELGRKRLDWSKKPDIYKEYEDSLKVSLPDFQIKMEKDFVTVLKERKSIRKYKNTPLELTSLSFLLWASTGIQRITPNYAFRTAPSAGALYPIETYILANNVTNLEKGLYHYNIRGHFLETLKLGDFSRELSIAALSQYMCMEAAVTFIWSAIFYRSAWKYEDRSFRYVFLDAGHIAQNLALSATGINLGTCQIGAFFDDEINEMLNLDGINETVIYLSTVGYY